MKKKNGLELNEKYNRFLKYLEYTYFGSWDENEYKSPIFPINMWSVFDRIKENNPRTTNGAESFHRTLNKAMEIPNPNIALFINTILEIELLNEIEIEQSTGGNITWSQQKYEKEQKIFILNQNYKFFTKENFLIAILKIFNDTFE